MKQVDLIITKTGINKFDPQLVHDHHRADHCLYALPANCDIVDILMYFFENDIDETVYVLQDYADGDPDATQIIEALKAQLPTGKVCIECVRRRLFDTGFFQ